MARKKKRDDLAAPPLPSKPTTSVDSARQPRILGWLVLITGACSTWYWYRPLPPTANESANSGLPATWATSQSGPKSLWNDDGLVVPSLNVPDTAPIPTSDLIANAFAEPQLVGPQKVNLVPRSEWAEPRQNLTEVLKTEKIPSVPIEEIIGKTPEVLAPKVWTPEQSAKVGVALERRSEWPDAGYMPKPNLNREKQKAATRITTQIPPLLDAGSRSIKTQEDTDSDRAGKQQLPIGVDNNKVTSSPEIVPPDPNRQPSFIRQPQPRNK